VSVGRDDAGAVVVPVTVAAAPEKETDNGTTFGSEPPSTSSVGTESGASVMKAR